jgi:catechol 2,3-dioxygenase
VATTAVDNPSGSSALLSDDARLGPVELTVTDLERSLAFYTGVIGLELLRRHGNVAALGAGGEELVVLHEEPAAPAATRTAGIYHYALLFPSREELARAALRIMRARTAIDGASDHGTHEAIYLPDPDGIGIELAADRPRERWPNYEDSEFARGGPSPLDVNALLETVAGQEPPERAAAGQRVGHVHLHVGDLEAATRFYRDGVGFEVMATLPTAVFASFGRYHHHLAYNLWRGRDVPPAPAGAVGLRHWTVRVSDDRELERVRARLESLGAAVEQSDGALLASDPSGIAVRLLAAGAG